MEEQQEITAMGRRVILTVVGLLLVLFVAVVMMTRAALKKEQSPVRQAPQVQLCDGREWTEVSLVGIPENRKARIKELLVRSSIETAALSGGTMVIAQLSLPEYLQALDAFYRITENQKVPLFFAMRLVEMSKNGAPLPSLTGYQAAVMQKLKESNLVQ